MPVRKIKSPDYLSFLATKKCVVTGSLQIDIHHESLLREFGGGLKNHNDFQALPLQKSLHLYKRHSMGKEKFWESYRINPYDLAISFLNEYLETGPEDFEEASFYRDKLIEQKDRWKGESRSRYKSL